MSLNIVNHRILDICGAAPLATTARRASAVGRIHQSNCNARARQPRLARACIVNSHRRSQDFVWGALFLTKKVDDLF